MLQYYCALWVALDAVVFMGVTDIVIRNKYVVAATGVCQQSDVHMCFKH